jgi:tetratricopeptide (TPR) repeat protein
MNKLIISVFSLLLFAASAAYAGYHEQGRAFYAYKKYDKAKEAFLKDVEIKKHGDSYYFLGEIEKMRGNYKEADEYFTEATKLYTTRKYLRNAHWNLIIMAEQKGDYGEVVKKCKAMWNDLRDEGAKSKIENTINKMIWTDNAEAIEKYKEGDSLKQEGKNNEAVSAFKSALGIESGFLAPKFEIGMIYYRNNKFSDAASYIRDVAEKVPFYAEAHMVLADIEFRNKNYSRAITHYNSAIEFGFVDKETESNLILNRGTCYYNLKEYENARDDIKKATKLKGGSIGSLSLLAAIQIMLHEYDDALESLQSVNKSNPDNPVIIFQIGSLYYKLKNDLYITNFEKLLTLSKGNSQMLEKYSKAFALLAEGYFNQKKYDQVLRIYTQLPSKTQSGDLKIIAARSYYRKGNYDEAINLFESAAISSDDDRLMLCRAYARKGLKEKAKNILTRLIRNEDYLKKARSDKLLVKLVDEIEESNRSSSDPDRNNPKQ